MLAHLWWCKQSHTVLQADINRNIIIKSVFNCWYLNSVGTIFRDITYRCTHIGLFLGISCRRSGIVWFKLSSNSHGNASSEEDNLTSKYFDFESISIQGALTALQEHRRVTYLHIVVTKSQQSTVEEFLSQYNYLYPEQFLYGSVKEISSNNRSLSLSI